MNAFDQLDRQIKSRLVELSIIEPTLPQEQAIPAILAGEDRGCELADLSPDSFRGAEGHPGGIHHALARTEQRYAATLS